MNSVTENLVDRKHHYRRWRLALFDFIPLVLITFFVFLIEKSNGENVGITDVLFNIGLSAICIYGVRWLFGIYRQIWRFGGVQAYICLIEADFVGGVLYYLIGLVVPFCKTDLFRKLSIVCINLLCSVLMRLIYQFIYQNGKKTSNISKVFHPIISFLTGLNIEPSEDAEEKNKNKIKIGIVGAGRIGTMFAEELIANKEAPYRPVCFVDIDNEKVGRQISGIKVISDSDVNEEMISALGIQEFVFALPNTDNGRKQKLYDFYKTTGCKLKTYDYPLAVSADSGKRHLREFDIEDLLCRQEKSFVNDMTFAYYTGKTVLISGGGGSIGSELCRQIAKMKPKKLVVLDIYENGAYDIQQDLKIQYGDNINIVVEIVSVCDRYELEKVFEQHRPDIVLHAAAHKHVPLMERNCCEAVKNNVFGTLNIVEVSEKYGVSKFTMISTDKAVNPTNVMGATKRMCEMIVQSRNRTKTNFSATRFGNVLGSNGSVIPLFKRQIANGGPLTLTDKRIIRYFMTIPEASQLVLQSGAMAKNGELYVLDMGKPIHILQLAESMIRLSGFVPYKDIDIVETGLRPGEKLYEELLIKTEELDKTDNELIFIERDTPLGADEIEKKLNILRAALDEKSDDAIRKALKEVVPTYHDPETVNANAVKAKEMIESRA